MGNMELFFPPCPAPLLFCWAATDRQRTRSAPPGCSACGSRGHGAAGVDLRSRNYAEDRRRSVRRTDQVPMTSEGRAPAFDAMARICTEFRPARLSTWPVDAYFYTKR